MISDNVNLSAYFRRIGFAGNARADVDTLKLLMRCQLFSVPFENLDIQSGRIVSLDPEDIFRKIVEERRGGYCYEVNGLFSMALEALGITHFLIAARPMTYPVRRPKTHMAVIAEIGGAQWLCDTGFGSYGIREPMNLALTGFEMRQDHETFRLSMDSKSEYLLQSFTGGTWKNLYEFNLCPQEWIDFEPANYLNSTHPDSIFLQGLMVVQQNPSGKDVLFGNSLMSVVDGHCESRPVSRNEIPLLLQEKFSLNYP
jgi:N-hydroxyarylamine O-acetyltransferase